MNTKLSGISGSEMQLKLVSLKALASRFDTTRSSVRRWLKEAGIAPVALGRGRNGTIRYKCEDIERWINERDRCL